MSDANVAAFARVLRPGGEFRFATDWANYAEWTLLRLLRSRDFSWTAERADDWRKPWPGFSGTRYEAKAKREGRAPAYLIFRKSLIYFCQRGAAGSPRPNTSLRPSSGRFSSLKRSGSSRGAAAGCGGACADARLRRHARRLRCDRQRRELVARERFEVRSAVEPGLLVAHGGAAPAVDDRVDEVLGGRSRMVGARIDDRLAVRNEMLGQAA